jgi:hypothetical protein
MPSIALAAGRDRFRGADQNRGTSGCPRVGRAACYYFAAVPASATRIDFDRVFADATQQSRFPYVDRARKSDRLPSFKAVLLEPALLPNCEPLASPFADPILGRIVGRCDV